MCRKKALIPANITRISAKGMAEKIYSSEQCM